MFAGIDIASDRHVLARLDGTGQPLGRPIGIDEDAGGYRMMLEALGPPPALVVMEATGHYWKNLFASLVAAGHDVVLLNPIVARRFQQARLERTKTDAIDAAALARFAFEKRPAPSYIHDAAAEALRELVRHRDRLQQDFEDRVLQLHRLVDLGFPEFTRYVKGMHTMLATALLSECPTAAAFARTPPRRLAGRRHPCGPRAATLRPFQRRHHPQRHGAGQYSLGRNHLCQQSRPRRNHPLGRAHRWRGPLHRRAHRAYRGALCRSGAGEPSHQRRSLRDEFHLYPALGRKPDAGGPCHLPAPPADRDHRAARRARVEQLLDNLAPLVATELELPVAHPDMAEPSRVAHGIGRSGNRTSLQLRREVGGLNDEPRAMVHEVIQRDDLVP